MDYDLSTYGRRHDQRKQFTNTPDHTSRRHHHSRQPRSRSRSPRRGEHRRHRRSRSPPPRPTVLPRQARELSKRDLETFKPLFASYLDIQKQIYIEDLDEREVKGRWKSFVSKWNRGELAEGWYDPATLQRANQSTSSTRDSNDRPESRTSATTNRAHTNDPSVSAQADSQSDEEDFGPSPAPYTIVKRSGPSIPKIEDLRLLYEDRSEERLLHKDDLRHDRKLDRKAQKERLEELVPRAEPNSRERQLEKKQEKTSTLNSFRDAKEAGDVEVGEADLMGDDGIDGYKKKKREQERIKNERELRREEIARARAAEREERLADKRAKDEKTMSMLKDLAKQQGY